MLERSESQSPSDRLPNRSPRRLPRTTLWRRIALDIKAAIAAGEWRAGDKLPPEGDLAARFNANRHTIRRAVGALAEEGLLLVEQGRGTFVVEETINYQIGARTRFGENLRDHDRKVDVEILAVEEIFVGREIANPLEVAAGSLCVRLQVLRRSDGQPLCIADHWFPGERFRPMAGLFAETKSITRSFAALGIADYKRRETQVAARLPKTWEATKLEIPRTRPLIVTSSINADPTGTVIEYGVTRFAADRTAIVFES
jgi:GntR family phosphonate transport system transcriptional regulator